MNGAEMFIAIGGSLLAFYLLWQALRRNADEDAYLRRGSLLSQLRSKPTGPAAAGPGVPLRPAAARILAQRGDTPGHKSASLRAGLTPVEPEGSPPPPAP